MNANLHRLLTAALGQDKAEPLMSLLHIPSLFDASKPGTVTRAELAQALNMALFHGLLERVPTGKAYTLDVARRGEKITFDHGALRTVHCPWTGTLPSGEVAITRVLKPLGYHLNGTYPLDRLKMMGRAYAHADAPEEIAQYFVSELFPDRLSPGFQQAAKNVLQTSRDPLTPTAAAQLRELERDGVLPLDNASELLPVLVRCFERQHDIPALADYETLLRESAEMAWIATEGNMFNHATDRVADVEKLAAEQKALGRPMKNQIEVSASGRVRQTAFKADTVKRQFVNADGTIVEKQVPGSFYEFITRDRVFDHERNRWVLDLGFDSSNAQGIFKMTAAG